MAKNVNSRSSKADLVNYARGELGINLPEEMTREDMYAAIKAELASQGGTLDDEDDGVNTGDNSTATGSVLQAEALQADSAPSPEPTHYTIKVSKPPLCTMPDMVITANGVNTQIQFNKAVKVSAAAYFVLVDAIELIPAHRDLETKEWNPAREEPRFNFVVISEHHE